MHETGIAEGILSSVLDAADGADAKRVNRVNVSIGVLTEVSEDALQFAWEVLRRDTIAGDATLDVTMLEALSVCADCQHRFGHGRWDGTKCPSCGSYVVSLVSGRELNIDSIDID